MLLGPKFVETLEEWRREHVHALQLVVIAAVVALQLDAEKSSTPCKNCNTKARRDQGISGWNRA